MIDNRNGSVRWTLATRLNDARIRLTKLDAHFPEARLSSIMFIGTLIAGLSNYLFNFLFGRLLGPSDYGLLVSLLSLAAVFSGPLASVNTFLTQRMAIAVEEAHPMVLRKWLGQALRWGIVLAITLAVVVLVGDNLLKRLLNVPETAYLVLIAVAIEASLMLSVVSGLVRGLEKFTTLSISMIVQGMSRIVLGLGLLGAGVAGVMSSTPLSYGLAVLVCAVPLISIGRRRTTKVPLAEAPFLSHFLYLLVTQTIIGLLINFDVIMARRLLSPEEAGLYAAISILGKAVLYLPAPVGDILFPRVSRQLKHSSQNRPIRMLLPGLVIVLGASIPVLIFLALIPGFVITFLYGDQYQGAATLLGWYGMAMFPLAVNAVLMQYFVATRSKVFTLLGGLAITVEGVLLSLFHSDLAMMVLGVGTINTAYVLILLILTLRPVLPSPDVP